MERIRCKFLAFLLYDRRSIVLAQWKNRASHNYNCLHYFTSNHMHVNSQVRIVQPDNLIWSLPKLLVYSRDVTKLWKIIPYIKWKEMSVNLKFILFYIFYLFFNFFTLSPRSSAVSSSVFHTETVFSHSFFCSVLLVWLSLV